MEKKVGLFQIVGYAKVREYVQKGVNSAKKRKGGLGR